MIISLSPGRINELLLRIKNMLYKKPRYNGQNSWYFLDLLTKWTK